MRAGAHTEQTVLLQTQEVSKVRARCIMCAGAIAVTVCVCLLTTDTRARESDADLLAIVLQGSREAASSIHSGAGRVTIRQSLRQPDGGLLETEGSYDIAFRGERYKACREVKYLSNGSATDSDPDEARILPGTVLRDEVTFDGVQVRRLDIDDNTGWIGSLETTMGRHEVLRWRQEFATAEVTRPIGCGVWDIRAFHNSLMFPNTNSEGPVVVGRDVIDNQECIVVEVAYDYSRASGDAFRDIRRFWVNPDRGFTVSRMRVWTEGGVYPVRTLVAECEIKTREYPGNLWGPGEYVETQYDLDRATGQTVQKLHKTITFDAGFRLNIPVSDAQLSLVFPSGTTIHDEVLDADYTVP